MWWLSSTLRIVLENGSQQSRKPSVDLCFVPLCITLIDNYWDKWFQFRLLLFRLPWTFHLLLCVFLPALSVPKTLRFRKRRNAAIWNRATEKLQWFWFPKVWAPSTCSCCLEGKKTLRFGICNFKMQRFAISFRDFSAIFLQNLGWELRFWICDLKTQRLRLWFVGTLSSSARALTMSASNFNAACETPWSCKLLCEGTFSAGLLLEI